MDSGGKDSGRQNSGYDDWLAMGDSDIDNIVKGSTGVYGAAEGCTGNGANESGREDCDLHKLGTRLETIWTAEEAETIGECDPARGSRREGCPGREGVCQE